MDDLSLRVYLENGSDAMRGGWLELPVVPERLDAFMRGVVGVDDGGGYAVVDHEPGWFGDVLGSDLESFSVSSLNLAARCVAHARDLAVADSVDGDVFLDMLATAAESEDVRFPSGIAALAARAGDVAEFWTEYSLPDSWRAGNSSPDELYGAHVAYGLMGDDAYSSLSYCMDLERLGRGCRGSLDDAAPPMDGPAGDEGMLLFNDLAFDSGFVARMDTLASRFADDFAHGRYDAGTALRETRSLVAEAAMLMETVTGASYGAGAADCAASLALSAVTDAVNGYVDDLVDRNDCDPRVAAANHAERSADPHARPGTLPCLRMFTTAYGKTDETDVFGDGAPVEGMESSSMQLTR